MADDGMLMNFSVDDTVVRYTPKFRGGSWKDRLVAKKVAKFRERKRAGSGLETGANAQPVAHVALGETPRAKETDTREEGDFPVARPQKRRRENGDYAHRTLQGWNTGNEGEQRHVRLQHSSKPREVISSLFTYNPTPSTAAEKSTESTEVLPSKPSNAPLPDGIDTFTSLGLSSTLAAHLLTKLELKNPTAIQKASIAQLLKEDSDAFIQSETGSGKTLAYLLPLVQRIMTLSSHDALSARAVDEGAPLHRDSGLFAVILAPTRELCKQISVVLERVLGCAHYIVAGTVIGGEKKKSEKARLRKGINLLVATPGRLVDHLENTRSLDVSNVRWLVLDEGDRLMDLGFEEEISKIVKHLDHKLRPSTRKGLPARRTTVLCSATMKMNVQKLGEISLKDAVLIKGDRDDEELSRDGGTDERKESAFLAPAQLKQSYIVAAAKLRLVTLTALLRRTFARKGSVMKAIVFVSCADSVEFHFRALSRSPESTTLPQTKNDLSEISEEQKLTTPKFDNDSVCQSPLLSSHTNASLTLYKLHGSLPQATRTSIVKAFAAATSPSLLIATDVASRGLDLPNLDLVIEYDPPFSADDHLHRIGRTARLGRDGRAVIFLLPGSEEGYIEVLKSSYKSTVEGTRAVTQTDVNEILKKGFAAQSGVASAAKDWGQAATDFQLEVERWVLSSPVNAELARKAFQSHIRAYATHIAAERKWFDIKELHLGHLAKGFGLREKPGGMNVVGMGSRGVKKDKERRVIVAGKAIGGDGEVKKMNETTKETEEAARKMKEVVRNRKRMMGSGADEFNIA